MSFVCCLLCRLRHQPELHHSTVIAVVAIAAWLQYAHKIIRKHARYAGGLQCALPPAAGHLFDAMYDGTLV